MTAFASLGLLVACASLDRQGTRAGTDAEGGTGNSGPDGGNLASGGTGNGDAGTSGTGGSGGSGATGASGGTTGVGGTGGSFEASCVEDAANGTPGSCSSGPQLRIEYALVGAEQNISFSISFFNLTASAIDVSELTFRYFFTDEEQGGWMLNVYDANISGGVTNYLGLTAAISKGYVSLTEPVPGADAYIELGFTTSALLHPSDRGFIKFEAIPTDHNAPAQVQSDDYSFGCDRQTAATWERIVARRNGELVAGCQPWTLPPPGAGGAAGAGPALPGGAGGAP